LQTITQRVSDAASGASDPYTGSLTSSIQAQQTQITTDQTAVTNWTSILADKKATLTTEYSNLVNTLSQLQTEQQYLTQQITMMDNENNNN
jgi:flagellar hook-associated protein 2